MTRTELDGSGIVNRPLSSSLLNELKIDFENLHHLSSDHDRFSGTGKKLLQAFILHLGREPRPYVQKRMPRRHASTIAKARSFILANLDRPLSINTIATAASASHRTLHRAFLEVLNETPYSYVQKMRLHRIRSELISDDEKACTIKIAVHRWGITELGRSSGWYNDLFGELPSKTIARRQKPAI
ncbi:helix-turn-helix domain-containing protein [Nitrobacter winogradskyi]|uniref:Transcriptional regulator GlxA family with amidase domain n=1 Tax=Nitrobacter winogradskyi TaxID=913 RepID=A0ACC6AQY3_NITWI|nr:helix-turn-helix domain-containing protein [Nitrobacter winogradskyi]MCP2001215.1 transcriptional regulator GlxA family with amidase domain [Nitrobacter winogradskyi]